MRLTDVAGSGGSVELEALTDDVDLTRELQERLAEIGLRTGSSDRCPAGRYVSSSD
jgi:hypothetical protein